MAQCVRAPSLTSCGWTAAPAVRRSRAALAVRAAAYGDRQNNAASRRQTLLAGGPLLGGLVLPGGAGAGAAAELATPPATDSIYDLSAFMYGEEVSLERYRGKVLMVLTERIVLPFQNVNYPGARSLYEKYKHQGFTLCAFPCNQFGGQAPGTSQEEREWAWRKFGFEFDVFDKIEVNGTGTHPIYQILKRQQPVSLPSSFGPLPGEPGRIEWNYTKFLVDQNGVARKRYKPTFNPADFDGDVARLLAGKEPLPAECIAHPGRKVCKVDA
ncbi:hypothetical protein COHA_009226 [Chlorella ohadii]|uniref:Glutathione peroxidase n=1 Tax=Chlorella ohadii TaxID=2649997 RepID=A0AAD5DM54_9CHLO|nr:hypothetical protein COHA_009226 [Chlorella ohadii]